MACERVRQILQKTLEMKKGRLKGAGAREIAGWVREQKQRTEAESSEKAVTFLKKERRLRESEEKRGNFRPVGKGGPLLTGGGGSCQ